MICKFTSFINEIVQGLVYELHMHNESHYKMKWEINGSKFEESISKCEADTLFEKGKFRIV